MAPVLRYRGFLRILAARPANLLVQSPLEKVEILAAPHAKALELSRVEQPTYRH